MRFSRLAFTSPRVPRDARARKRNGVNRPYCVSHFYPGRVEGGGWRARPLHFSRLRRERIIAFVLRDVLTDAAP
jgi:hypothetical protein